MDTLFVVLAHIIAMYTFLLLFAVYIYIHSVLQSWHCEDPWQAGVLRDPWPR